MSVARFSVDFVELSTCPAGTVARVRLIDLPPEECARLRELGLGPDTVVQVIQCGAFKSRVIAVGSDRFAIDGRTCRCIQLYDDEGQVQSRSRKTAAGKEIVDERSEKHDDAATYDAAHRASAESTPKNRRKTPLVPVP